MAHISRWLPALVAPLLVAGAVAVPLAAANASPTLPQRSSAQIIASISHAARIEGFSGTLKQDSNLGLPQLPAVGNTGGTSTNTPEASILSALGSDQTLRVAVARGEGTRVQVLESMGEQDLIVNRGNIWQWDNASQQATHVKLPAVSADQLRKLQAHLPKQLPNYSPLQLSEQLISGLDDHTRVSVEQNRYVAGQATYGLTFTPVEKNTLVSSLQVQVDAQTGMPLRFAVYAKGQADPAYELGYTSLNYTVPAASTFAFKAPSGAKVKTLDYTLPALKAKLEQARGEVAAKQQPNTQANPLQGVMPQLKNLPKVQTRGSGWATVLDVPASENTAALLDNKSLTALTTRQANGDRLIRTSLLSVLIHRDGSISLGAVPVGSL